MATTFGNIIGGTVDAFVRWIVLPITGIIPRLVSSGVLLVVFGALWLAFGAALAVDPGALDETWHRVGQLPLPVQGIAWLLFLPPLAGLWVWGTDWPLVVRLVVVGGLAGWNLLVFVPRRDGAAPDQVAA